MSNKTEARRGRNARKRWKAGKLARRIPSSFWLLLGFVLVIHLLWELLNDTPPVWDMAVHQSMGWKYLAAWKDGSFFRRFAEISTSYPPLYYLLEASFLGCFGDTQFLAFLTNLPALILLSYCTYRIACFYLGRAGSRLTGVLPLLFPMVAWVSRETLLDVLLAGWVTAAGWLILRSRFFEDRRWTLLFGLVSAAGVMTKWTFPIYLVVPLFYGLWVSGNRRRSLFNLMTAALVALPLALVYYLPNLAQLASHYPTTEQTGLIPWKPYPRHGEPGLNNILGWIYYPRVFSSYFLYLPLTGLFLVGALLEGREELEDRPFSSTFLWLWLAGGTVLLTFVTPKDPRFALPLIAPLAVLLAYFWRGRPGWLKVILGISLVQYLTVSLPLPFAPIKIALFERKDDRDFQTLQQEWVFYQTSYFEVAGPPRREHWPYAEIMQSLPVGATLGFLPDLPRFHPEGMMLQVIRSSRTIRVIRLGVSERWESRLPQLDFVVSKTGYQGISFITGYNLAVVDALPPLGWTVISEWPLPDGSLARLWKKG